MEQTWTDIVPGKSSSMRRGSSLFYLGEWVTIFDAEIRESYWLREKDQKLQWARKRHKHGT